MVLFFIFLQVMVEVLLSILSKLSSIILACEYQPFSLTFVTFLHFLSFLLFHFFQKRISHKIQNWDCFIRSNVKDFVKKLVKFEIWNWKVQHNKSRLSSRSESGNQSKIQDQSRRRDHHQLHQTHPGHSEQETVPPAHLELLVLLSQMQARIYISHQYWILFSTCILQCFPLFVDFLEKKLL